MKILLQITLGLWVLSAGATEFVTNRALVGQNDPIEVKLRFNKYEVGDLYVAVQVGDRLFFYGEDGSFSEQAVPRSRAGHYSGEIDLFSFPPGVVPSFPYFLYAVVTDPGADVFDSRNWHGGWDGLGIELVQVGDFFFGSRDADGDGFYDDDFNRDGFHDDDMDRNGWHDGDLDHDGWHDDDRDHDGRPDSGNDTRGQALYAQHCASCHGQVPDQRRRGKDAEDIAEAIVKNKGGMGFLAGILNASDIQDIAAYLSLSNQTYVPSQMLPTTGPGYQPPTVGPGYQYPNGEDDGWGEDDSDSERDND